MIPFRLEPLDQRHKRAAFASGEAALDRYFHIQVTQDIRRRVANCFVAVESATGRVAAYYTLASASIPTPDLPPEQVRRLPRYPTVPAARIGRLAVDLAFQGRGLGAALLADAARRVLSAAPAAFALLVDAKHERAAAFYRHHGFQPLASAPQSHVGCAQRTFSDAEYGTDKDPGDNLFGAWRAFFGTHRDNRPPGMVRDAHPTMLRGFRFGTWPSRTFLLEDLPPTALSAAQGPRSWHCLAALPPASLLRRSLGPAWAISGLVRSLSRRQGRGERLAGGVAPPR